MCVSAVCFEDVEEVVDVCLRCCIFDSFPVLLIDVYSVEVDIHGFFIDGFGSDNEISRVVGLMSNLGSWIF